MENQENSKRNSVIFAKKVSKQNSHPSITKCKRRKNEILLDFESKSQKNSRKT